MKVRGLPDGADSSDEEETPMDTSSPPKDTSTSKEVEKPKQKGTSKIKNVPVILYF